MVSSVTLLGVILSQPVQAQTFYSDRTSFNAASTSLTTLNFDNLLGTPGYPDNATNDHGFTTPNSGGFIVDGVRFVGQNNNDGIPYGTFLLSPSFDAGFYSLNGTADLLGSLASLTVTLPTGVTTFGTDIEEQKTGDPIIINA